MPVCTPGFLLRPSRYYCRPSDQPPLRGRPVVEAVGQSGFAMSALRIYGVARTRAFRALWMAQELGLDYEHIPIEIGEAGARKPEFLAINPNGRLPAIDDDGFVLTESLAITLYLAKKYSSGKLYPATLQARRACGNGACGRCRRSTAP